MLACLLGALLIVGCFLYWGDEMPTEILVLNIIISLFIYGAFFIDVLCPWIDLKDKSQKQVAGLGLRWVVTWGYAISAIVAMVVMNSGVTVDLIPQLIVHGILAFLMMLGFAMAMMSMEKADEVYHEEASLRRGVADMKGAVEKLSDALFAAGANAALTARVAEMTENLRFLSPSNNPDAHTLEEQYVSAVNSIISALPSRSINIDTLDPGTPATRRLEQQLDMLDRIYQRRKAVYSE